MTTYKCKVCGVKFENERNDLYSHYEEKHSDIIPKDWSGARYNFYLIHNRDTGKCKTCGRKTEWNDSTNLPDAFCKNPKCREEFRQQFLKRMNKKYGKDHLLNDPEVQKKMMFNRKISGEYTWSDGVKKKYVGSFEKDALRFLDIFMNYKSHDVFTPAPQIIDYDYTDENGVTTTHFYIPDQYIASLNLVLEIKDGGDNPNTHPKIQKIDKVKEHLKDEAIKKSGVNYYKIENKQYGGFLKYLASLKMEDVKIEKPKRLSESCILSESEYSQIYQKSDENIYIGLLNTYKSRVMLLADNMFLDCLKTRTMYDDTGLCGFFSSGGTFEEFINIDHNAEFKYSILDLYKINREEFDRDIYENCNKKFNLYDSDFFEVIDMYLPLVVEKYKDSKVYSGIAAEYMNSIFKPKPIVPIDNLERDEVLVNLFDNSQEDKLKQKIDELYSELFKYETLSNSKHVRDINAMIIVADNRLELSLIYNKLTAINEKYDNIFSCKYMSQVKEIINLKLQIIEKYNYNNICDDITDELFDSKYTLQPTDRRGISNQEKKMLDISNSVVNTILLGNDITNAIYMIEEKVAENNG